jgi:hypothetical protein
LSWAGVWSGWPEKACQGKTHQLQRQWQRRKVFITLTPGE